jgi:hypothetical protein
MPTRRRRRSVVVAPLAFLALIVVAACGGAVDNTDLFKKSNGTTTTTGTPTATPTATSSPTTLPPSTPTVPPTKPDPQCGVSFAADVMQVFDQAGCASLACHGGEVNAPSMDQTSPALTYKSLINFTLSNGDPYVEIGNTDPKASSITCNLRGNCGTRMPLTGKLNSNQLSVIDGWIACGAPFN